MEQAPFKKRPVDGIRPNTVLELVSVPKKKKTGHKLLLSKLLGVGFACMLAFFIYSLYTSYTGLDDKDLITSTKTPNINTENSIDTNNTVITEKFIGVDVSNVSIDENIRIKSTKLAPFTDITFTITKPDGSIYEFTATSTITGYAETNLNPDNLKKAGEYSITASADGYISTGTQRFFLRPGKVSAKESKIETTAYQVQIDKEAEVIVTLSDKYKNPIEKHTVVVTSTRPDDIIQNSGKTRTDENGKIHFKVSSPNEGKSSYLALDQESGITLANKIEIQYVLQAIESDEENESSSMSSLLNYIVPKAFAAGEISYYVIESPAFFEVGEETSILVKAYDGSNNILTGYLGRIEFTSSDESALIIPPDYTFIESDLGEHTFQITLNTPGSYLLTVSSTGNPSIKGEKQVTAESDEEDTTGDLTKPEILSPPKGTTERTTVLSASKIDIAGKADPEITIEIYDDSTKLGEVISNASNLFFFQTDELVDGRHNIKVVAIDDEGNSIESDTVSVIIDTTNPVMLREALEIEPQQVKPGEVVTFTVKTEANLDSVKAVVNKTAVTLIESTSQAGTYIGTYTAPEQAGTFQIDIELKDTVSNPVMFEDQGDIIVTLSPVAVTPTPTPEPVVITPVPTPTPVPINQPDSGPAEIMLIVFIVALPLGWKLMKN